MVDAPEKIWAVFGNHGLLAFRDDRPHSVEYTRSDLVAELEAENERLTKERDDAQMVKREAIAGWRDAEALSRTGAVKVIPKSEVDDVIADLEYWADRLGDIHQPQGQTALKYAASILSALEPAAPEGQQEAAAWQSQDLIESVSYVSKNFGLVRYEGIDRYFGQSTHKFSTRHGARYVLPEALNDFLAPKPVARPAEQAVTEAMVEVAISIMFHKHGWFPPRQVVKDALKAAMEAGR